MNDSCKLLSVAILVLIASSCFYNLHYTIAQTDQASSKLQTANNLLEQAFNAIVDAENAGANVTTLLNQLNNAANILAQAENAYTAGNNTLATNDADTVVSIGHEVIVAAQTAQDSASVSIQTAFWLTITFTAIAVAVFVIALFLVWRWFKRVSNKTALNRMR